MRAPRRRLRIIPVMGVLILGSFLLLSAQVVQDPREVVASEVSVSSAESSLRLEFRDGESLEVTFRDGRVLVDGREEGRFTRGAGLDTAWRGLLSQAVALDNGSVGQLLAEWAPPGGLSGDEAQVAQRLSTRLRGALQQAIPAPPTVVGTPSALDRIPLGALLTRAHRLPALAEALEGVTLDAVNVEVGRNVLVEPGERVEGSLVVVDGDVEVRGEVAQNLVVVGGDLRLFPGSRVGGDVRLSQGSLLREDGEVEGTIRRLAEAVESVREEAQEAGAAARATAAEAREEARARARSRSSSSSSPSLFTPLRRVGSGLAGLFQTLLSLGILTGIGLLIRTFFPDRLEAVSRTARDAPGRSAMVGIAGLVLFFPAWVVGMVVLVISIVGIPLVLVWIPALPLALAAGGLLGFLAVARIVGEWVTEREVPGLEWARSSNEVHIMLVGVGALLAALAASHVVQMGGPLLGFLRVILALISGVVMFGAVVTGLGAVLLSRAGRDPSAAGYRYGWGDPSPRGEEP